MVVAPLLGDLGEDEFHPSQEQSKASTRRDLRLSHTCGCFDRFCAQAPTTTSIEFPAIFAVISMGRFLPPATSKRHGSAARLHVLARPLGKGGEAAGSEGIRCGDGGPRVRTEIGMRLEVLEHLAQLLG